MTLATSILLLVPAVLQAGLAILLLRKRLHRLLPFFFSYTTFAAAASFLKFGVQSNYSVYFYTYWLTEAVYAALGLAAILEIFPYVFKSFSRVAPFRLIIGMVVGIMVILSVFHAISSGVPVRRMINLITALEITVRYVQGAVFFIFVAMVLFYRVPWPRYAFGIVFGFGLLAASRLAAALLRSEFGMRFNFLSTSMPGVVYIFAVLTWLFSFWRPQPPDPMEKARSPLSPEEVAARVRQLSKDLKGSAP